MSTRRFTSTRWLWAALLGTPILGLTALGITGCGNAGASQDGTKQPSAAAVPRVQTVTVQKQDLTQSIELPGTVEGFETADLYAKVGGYLDEISVDIGDRVEADQVLATLWIPEMQKELEEKRAAVASAEAMEKQAQAALAEATVELEEKKYQLDFRIAEYDRKKELTESGSYVQKLLDEATYQRNAAQAAVETTTARIRTAGAKLDSANANVRLAEAERNRVETLMAYREIRAPFDGVVTKRNFHRGAYIQPADGNSAWPLVTVTRTDVVRIVLELPMAEVRWLQAGDKAVLDRINVLPGERFEGEVTRFANALDRSSRLMRVEVDLENPEHRLLPGYYGYVTLLLSEFRQTPVVPSSALMAEGSEMFVYRMEGDVCRKRMVTTNYQDGTIVGISTGLVGGEQIVLGGMGQYTDGQTVVAVNSKSGT